MIEQSSGGSYCLQNRTDYQAVNSTRRTDPRGFLWPVAVIASLKGRIHYRGQVLGGGGSLRIGATTNGPAWSDRLVSLDTPGYFVLTLVLCVETHSHRPLRRIHTSV
jgi:hypothetical protein